ncbi:FG-GAP repeat protein [Actinocorallia lasiicapitis]
MRRAMSPQAAFPRLAVASALILAVAPAAPVSAAVEPGEAQVRKAPAEPGDFNGDGKVDFVVGAPGTKIAKKARAGAVSVVYLGVGKRQLITQASKGVPGGVGKNHDFGSSLGLADFDRDGYGDLAVGSSGGTAVLYGSKKGLGLRSAWLGGGSRVAVGDFNGDGKADLVTAKHNAYKIVLGVGKGNTKGRLVKIGRARDELFPVAGDFTGDGATDLALLGQGTVAGSAWTSSLPIRLALGGKNGLGAAKAIGQRAGTVGTAVDVNGDGTEELITQAPWGENGPGEGAIQVLPGEPKGLGAPFTIDQQTPEVPGDGNPGRPGRFDGDNFGGGLASGDVNGDGFGDVIVGAPGEDLGAARDAGAFTVLYGAKIGLTGAGSKTFTQNTGGVPGGAYKNDLFGSELQAFDFTGDGKDEIVAAAPGEGSFTLFRGATAGVSAAGVRLYAKKNLGVRGSVLP